MPTDEKVTQGECYRAGCPKLGARLLAVVHLVGAGRSVADIGCDHGKLAVNLALSGKVPKVIAVDRRPMPLARAKGLVRQTACAELVDCRLGDGLSVLQPHEVQEIVIAGMSGETMVHILQSSPWVQSNEYHLILVPTTQHGFLRHWLGTNGFAIEQEVPVEEKGRYYTVLSVGYSGEKKVPTPIFCALGRVAEVESASAEGYIRKRLAHLQKKAKADLTKQESEALQALIKEVSKCLK